MIAKQNTTKKSAFADLVRLISLHDSRIDTLAPILNQVTPFVKWMWTHRELNPVSLGYQSNLASLPSPHQINCNKYEIHKS